MCVSASSSSQEKVNTFICNQSEVYVFSEYVLCNKNVC